ncbi:MAG: hypothetical protein RL359_932, partial [Actinomycetota bacterium]
PPVTEKTVPSVVSRDDAYGSVYGSANGLTCKTSDLMEVV